LTTTDEEDARMAGTAQTGSGPEAPFRLALVGAGRVGTATAALLQRRGHAMVGVASRSAASAARAADALGTPTFSLDEAEGLRADVLLLAVPDDAIAGVAARLAGAVGPGTVVWHTSGAQALEPLRATIDAGAWACALHPMQACPTVESALQALPGSAWGVTVSQGLEGWARRLVAQDLDGRPVDVPAERRALWHAASITTSTGVNAVMSLGEALLEEMGIARPEEALAPLVSGTIEHSRVHGGARRTITGPVVRAEVGALQRHLEALSETSEDGLRAGYLTVARLVLARARAAGRMDESAARSVAAALEAAE
jgi:predicted short-subunit dehydrogenase-like oxidoreductase (DUF2520 family)